VLGVNISAASFAKFRFQGCKKDPNARKSYLGLIKVLDFKIRIGTLPRPILAKIIFRDRSKSNISSNIRTFNQSPHRFFCKWSMTQLNDTKEGFSLLYKLCIAA